MNNKECPICHAETDHYIPVVWDFHSNEMQTENMKYYQCFNCGCFFLDEFRNWTPEMYSERIYNADYAKTDPAFNGLRAYRLLPNIIMYIKRHPEINRMDKDKIQILDYGGGTGILADLLKEEGYKNSYCYDPYGRIDIEPVHNSFNVVIAIEVLEHIINADSLWNEISSKLKRGGLFIASTDLYQTHYNLQSWYYANPRAGHCILYTEKALNLIAKRYHLLYLNHIYTTGDTTLHLFKKY